MSLELSAIAKETVAISERGEFVSRSGHRVTIRTACDEMLGGTTLYTPSSLAGLVRSLLPVEEPACHIRIEVTGESTSAALRRLCVDEGLSSVCALNFASAKNPGGGFLNGAKAQEEDLCRVSALYVSLRGQQAYYEANRGTPSMLYLDYAIYSPRVPFFRDEGLALLETTFVASVLTMPAPNAGEHLRRAPEDRRSITETLERRMSMVLALARSRGDRALVLGAWGCGVFRNDPVEVATLWRAVLSTPVFKGAFDRVVFAVYDRAGSKNRAAFEEVFGTAI